MKHSFKKAIRAVGFLCILIGVTVGSSYLLMPKGNDAEDGINNPVAHGFLSEPENTIDITVIGNSDAYSGFSPMVLWETFGYTSYVSGEGKQSPAQSYAMLKKVLERHHPRLAVLETDNFFSRSKVVESAARIINAGLGSPFSVFQYHDRWKTVKAKELFKKPNYLAHCAFKGQWVSTEVKPYNGGEYMVKTARERKIPKAGKNAVDAFLDLCRKEQVEVLFVAMPSASSWSYKKHNAVKRFADDRGIPFLDLNLDRDRFRFDWTTDTRDGGNHLNNQGAAKATRFIGNYIADHYAISDHRAEEAYQQWDADYREFLRTETGRK